jgi:hypothetical protein
MWRWSASWRTVAHLPNTERSEGRGVFALVVRSRDTMFVVYSRVGKNRDTRMECPVEAGPGRDASHKTVLFSYPIAAIRRDNCIYRPVMVSYLFYSLLLSQRFCLQDHGGSPKS